jgi:hypothetical protein
MNMPFRNRVQHPLKPDKVRKEKSTSENNACPKFVAYAQVDSYVESSDDLQQLLSILRGLHSPDVPEDVTVWADDNRLVAVMLSDGRIIRFDV